MEKVKVLYREPVEAIYKEIKVFNNLDEYLKAYSDKDFVRSGYNEWGRITVDGVNYYSSSTENSGYCRNYEELFLTEECYQELLRYCKRTYSLHERDLFRTQSNSNCRFTGDLASKEDVINYMKNDERSWLPNIVKEIDEDILETKNEIKRLEDKIKRYEDDKKKLYDEDYLKSKIETTYTFDSMYYKSFKIAEEIVSEKCH